MKSTILPRLKTVIATLFAEMQSLRYDLFTNRRSKKRYNGIFSRHRVFQDIRLPRINVIQQSQAATYCLFAAYYKRIDSRLKHPQHHSSWISGAGRLGGAGAPGWESANKGSRCYTRYVLIEGSVLKCTWLNIIGGIVFHRRFNYGNRPLGLSFRYSVPHNLLIRESQYGFWSFLTELLERYYCVMVLIDARSTTSLILISLKPSTSFLTRDDGLKRRCMGWEIEYIWRLQIGWRFRRAFFWAAAKVSFLFLTSRRKFSMKIGWTPSRGRKEREPRGI